MTIIGKVAAIYGKQEQVWCAWNYYLLVPIRGFKKNDAF
jgi:hypothetical protein